MRRPGSDAQSRGRERGRREGTREHQTGTWELGGAGAGREAAAWVTVVPQLRFAGVCNMQTQAAPCNLLQLHSALPTAPHSTIAEYNMPQKAPLPLPPPTCLPLLQRLLFIKPPKIEHFCDL